jgi:hypothetical protein
VIINNSIPVDLDALQDIEIEGHKKHSQIRNTKGWGNRVLFDKKVFLALLAELERMRKIKTVKKRFYVFHEPYEGLGEAYHEWR